MTGGDRAPDGSLLLLPAVDVAAGRAAQVVDGGPVDPYAVALRWVERGAQQLHLVDLDRAFGRGDNAALLADLVDRLPVPVQLSGGLADAGSIAWAEGTGASRLVLASSVLADPDLLRETVRRCGAERVVAAVDVRADRVVSRGSDLDLGPLDAVLPGHPALELPGHVLVADAARDGSRRGSDLGLFTRVAGLGGAPVIASGGVASLDDLQRLRALTAQGVRGVVLGSALYHGGFTLEQALEVCR